MFKIMVRVTRISAAAATLLMPLHASAQDAPKLTLSDMAQMQHMLMQQIKPCIPPHAAVQMGKVILRVRMNPNGTLAGAPVVLSSTSAADGSILIRAFSRCITPETPLRFSPEKYAAWKEFNYTSERLPH
ncbi:cell envelope integrity protein TolA [Labrys sp. KB_33_2]|uniref:cell envelope integrity protein TolA n=1 Tax=Labrys sp. KB_33_2 TaxID=3237479 RepID=UPI003F8E11A9